MTDGSITLPADSDIFNGRVSVAVGADNELADLGLSKPDNGTR